MLKGRSTGFRHVWVQRRLKYMTALNIGAIGVWFRLKDTELSHLLSEGLGLGASTAPDSGFLFWMHRGGNSKWCSGGWLFGYQMANSDSRFLDLAWPIHGCWEPMESEAAFTILSLSFPHTSLFQLNMFLVINDNYKFWW